MVGEARSRVESSEKGAEVWSQQVMVTHPPRQRHQKDLFIVEFPIGNFGVLNSATRDVTQFFHRLRLASSPLLVPLLCVGRWTGRA